MTQPCKNCSEREIGCHSHCDRYKVYKAKWKELREKASHSRAADQASFDGRNRMMRARNKAPKK